MEYSKLTYGDISPYQATKVQAYSKGELLRLDGYSKISPDKKELCDTLMNTVESIKSFFWNQYRLVGVDDQGKIPIFLIYLPEENAYYRPQSVHSFECFVFNEKYVSNPEVVCHEFTHGVIENLNPLGNQGQKGAINEAIADIVGMVFKQTVYMKQGWTIGSRDLSHPFKIQDLLNTQPQYDSQGKTTNDNGNVHHNSRLISHAYYNAAKSWELYSNKDILKIWWDAAIQLQEQEKTFVGFARKTIMLSKGSEMLNAAIVKAWQIVDLYKIT